MSNNIIDDLIEFMKNANLTKNLGTISIKNQYLKNINESKEELLLTGFITSTLFERFSFGEEIFKALKEALERGVKIKYLWSFEFDTRSITYVEILKNRELFGELISKFYEKFNLEIIKNLFEMKFIHRRIPTYYDIFDKERIIIKFQNLSSPSQIYSSLSMIDLELAKFYRKEFLDTWLIDAIEDNPESYKHTFWKQMEKKFLR